MAFFQSIHPCPQDPILSIPAEFAADERETKVNLGVGAYRDENLKPYVFSSIRKAEEELLQKGLSKEYLPILGDPLFKEKLSSLIWGETLPDAAATVQTIGGSSALRIAAEFLVKQLPTPKIFVPHPTWPNHRLIFQTAGLTVEEYPYYDAKKRALDLSSLLSFISHLPKGSPLLLQASCHNPTGIDPNLDEWREISQIVKKQGLFPLFDMAYQGLGAGLTEDAAAVRLFLTEGHEMGLCYSCSKNFGLYGERVGLFSLVVKKKETAKTIATHLSQLVRGNFSNPPLHGAALVAKVLSTEKLTMQWQEELSSVRTRVAMMRKLLAARLKVAACPINTQFINEGRGLFSLLQLSGDQMNLLKREYGIYTAPHGRINLAGLNEKNIPYVADSITKII